MGRKQDIRNPRLLHGLWAEYNFRCFLSYTHADSAWADKLDKRLSAFILPRELEGVWTPFGPPPKTLKPFYRDRGVQGAHHSIDEAILEKLDDSASLIVICSPHAAQSKHVENEIRHFVTTGRRDRIFSIIIDGEPNDQNASPFPPALRYALNENGDIDRSKLLEPVAADARQESDGWPYAFHKLVAGMLGVDADLVSRRDMQRERWEKRRRLIAILVAANWIVASVALVFAALNLGESKTSQARFLIDQALNAAEDIPAISPSDLVVAADLTGRCGRSYGVDALTTLARVARICNVSLADLREVNPSVDPSNVLPGEQLAIPDEIKDVSLLQTVLIDLEYYRGAIDGVMGPAVRAAVRRFQADLLKTSELSEVEKAATITGVLTFNQSRILLDRWRSSRLLLPKYLALNAIPQPGQIVSPDPDVRLIQPLRFALDDAVIAPFLRLRHDGPVSAASFSPDGRRIVTASEDGTARLWDHETGGQIGNSLLHDGPVRTAFFSPSGDRIITESYSDARNVVQTWDISTSQLISEFEQQFLAVSPDGSTIVVAAAENSVDVYDIITGELTAQLSGHEDQILSAAFSPEGRQIVTASMDGTARLWDRKTGEPLAVFVGHLDSVTSAFFSPDGAKIVTTSNDQTIRIWDVESSKVIATLEGHGNRIYSASFSPDGKRLVTASADGSVVIWEAETGAPLITFSSSRSSIKSATYSPDGRFVITISESGAARIWNAETGSELLALREGAGRINGASFSPDSTSVVTSGNDGIARVWRVVSSGFDEFFDDPLGGRIMSLQSPVLPGTSAQFHITPIVGDWFTLRRALCSEQSLLEYSPQDIVLKRYYLLSGGPHPCNRYGLLNMKFYSTLWNSLASLDRNEKPKPNSAEADE